MLKFWTVLLQLLAQVAAALQVKQAKEQRQELEQDVQDIREDPVAYSQRRFGRMRDGAEAGDLPSDSAAGPDDTKG